MNTDQPSAPPKRVTIKTRKSEEKMSANKPTSSDPRKNLVEQILATFEDPARWPMTDDERIGFCKSVYAAAKAIRSTEKKEKSK